MKTSKINYFVTLLLLFAVLSCKKDAASSVQQFVFLNKTSVSSTNPAYWQISPDVKSYPDQSNGAVFSDTTTITATGTLSISLPYSATGYPKTSIVTCSFKVAKDNSASGYFVTTMKYNPNETADFTPTSITSSNPRFKF